MNCPNCGGLLDLKNRKCDYCNTTFTEAELGINKEVPKKEVEPAQPEREKTMTEKRMEEIEKERANRPDKLPDNHIKDAMTGAAVWGLISMFTGIRGFFRDLKRTVCMILLVALEGFFAFTMISGKVTQMLSGELEGFVAVNILIIVNALLAGIISRIGYIRAGTAITAVVNSLAVVWVFIYPLIKTDFAGQTPQSVAVLAVVEIAVLAVSITLSHMVYRRY